MMITKKEFGQLLQKKLTQTNDLNIISNWANELFFNNIKNLEPGLKDILNKLSLMGMGSEFEYTLDELFKMSNELIEGKV